jgi:hypothetical protein
MEREEIRLEIQKLIDQVPDDTLQEIYETLKEVVDKSADVVKLSHNLNKILSEDRALLRRLAQ